MNAQTPAVPAPTLKTVLLAQLRSTHDQQDWFVPASKAVAGLTAEQASWKENDGRGNNSIAQLVSHLVFWNQAQLLPLYAGPFPPDIETFGGSLDEAGWKKAVSELDRVLSDMERWIESSDDKTLQAWYDTIAHVSAHNAYHTGQILYIRKQQGSWDPEKGVK